jgi:excisionase family DNA binding protein
MSEYLRIREAAALLKITMQTLRNWDKQGKLKPHRHPMNNYRLYRKSDLIKLLNKIENK